MLIDNMGQKVLIFKLPADTHNLAGVVEAQCLPNAIYALIVSNIPGAWLPYPDPAWKEDCVVIARVQAQMGDQLGLSVLPESRF